MIVPTTGAIENFRGLRDNRFDLVVAQQDAGAAAFRGEGPFAVNGSFANLREIMLLHREIMTVVAAKGAGVRTLSDMAGKRVHLGETGTAVMNTARIVIAAAQLDPPPIIVELKPDEGVNALCGGQIDAAFMLLSHPSALLLNTMERCRTRLVPIDVDIEAPGVHSASLPAGFYPNQKTAILVLDLRFALFCRADFSDLLVTKILSTVNSNRSMFTYLHPSLIGLRTLSMVPTPGIVPVHLAAAQYFADTPEVFPK